MAYNQDPDKLPDARQCIQDYSMGQAQQKDAALMKSRMRGAGGIERLSQDSDEDWLVLWSIGLAGKYNGVWYLSPYLLDSPKVYREMQFRLQRAIHSTLTPIYQAWVYYCEKKYSLRELDADGSLMLWDPKSVLNALQNMDVGENADLEMCKKVRAVRNWVQHEESESQDNCLKDHRQTRMCVLRTCAKVITMLDPNGNPR